jgi:hypothetical protein
MPDRGVLCSLAFFLRVQIERKIMNPKKQAWANIAVFENTSDAQGLVKRAPRKQFPLNDA